MEEDSLSKGRILYVVAEDWYFCSHRLPIARAARDAGFEVVVATRVGEHGARIEEEGFRLVPLSMRRRGKNPLGELRSVAELVGIYRRERPDLVHHVALKPVLYGSMAARLSGVGAAVNALAGLGYVFSSSERKARVIRPLVEGAFRFLLNRKGSVVLLQNPDDRALLVERGIVASERTALIRGSGVDTCRFCPVQEPEEGPVTVTLVARMLKDKGVEAFVQAARSLRREGVSARFVLVGTPDPDNPTSIPEQQLRAWHDEGVIEWWGRRDDIPAVWAQSHLSVLPTSYGEGVPKSLIESASCGRPIIATDMPGCREIVRDGENGRLVPAGDQAALERAMRELIESPELRKRMGQAGRRLVEAEFSEEIVVERTMALYRKMLGGRWPEHR